MSKIGVTILLSLISCLLSIANITYRAYQENEKKNSFELAKTKDWEILLLKRDNPESLQQIRVFLENMNIVKGEQVIFGFLAKKDPDKHWDESLVDPKEDEYKVKLPEIKD